MSAHALELAVGARHVCVRDADGQIACRGRGDDGELGDGRSTSSSTLVYPLLP
jgi:hypothetical protein